MRAWLCVPLLAILLVTGMVLALPIAAVAGLSTMTRGPAAPLEGPPLVFVGKPGSRWVWPVEGPITSPYGWRNDPFSRGERFHTGVDIGADMDTPIHAAGEGVVGRAGWGGSYGNLVVIDHGGDVQTWYGHQAWINVRVGQKVHAGDIIGYVGSTGLSTGPHLHFEVRLNGETTDPMAFYHRGG